MNTVPQPHHRTPLEPGERRHVKFSNYEANMTISKYGVSIPERDNWVYMERAEAIEAAKAILLAYNVPFKNAVKGSGLEG